MPEDIFKNENSTQPVHLDKLPGKDGEGMDPHQDHVRFISHSQFFYFWPIIVASFIFWAISRFYGVKVTLPESGKSFYVAKGTGLGLLYLIIIFVVIFFTSVDLRGVWAALAGAVAIILALVFYIAGWWGPILKWLGGIELFINAKFYLAMGVVMGIAWLLVLLYDHRHYIEVYPTQLIVVEEVGEGEKNYDMVGIRFEKKRDNFFQHWFLGFGSGDLIIITPSGHKFDFPNVLRIGKRLEELHRIKERRGR